MSCNKTNDPKLQNTPDTPDFWLENRIFHNNLCVYAFMHYHISSLISASIPIITLIIDLSTFYIYFV